MNRHLPALCTLVATLAGPVLAVPGRPEPDRQEPGGQEQSRKQEQPIERLEEWPELPDPARSKKDVQRLRKARTEAMGAEAHDALVLDGAGIVPLLLPPLAKEKDKDTRLRILRVLDLVTGAPHTRLLAREFEHRSGVVRTWALGRAAMFPDTGVLDAASAVFTRLSKEDKKADEQELFAATLCITSAGSIDGLDGLLQRAIEDWPDDGPAIRAALESVRGPAATDHVLPGLKSDVRKTRLASLRLLAGCGTPEAAREMLPFLDDTDNGLRIGAINALRGMLDGDPPIDKLSAFEAIERSQKWKARL